MKLLLNLFFYSSFKFKKGDFIRIINHKNALTHSFSIARKLKIKKTNHFNPPRKSITTGVVTNRYKSALDKSAIYSISTGDGFGYLFFENDIEKM